MQFITGLGLPKMLIVLAVMAATLFYVVQKFRKSMARTYVLNKKVELADQLTKARNAAESLKAGHKSLKAVKDLEYGFGQFARLSRYRDAEWIAQRAEIDLFEKELKIVIEEMSAGQPGK